MKIAKFKQLSDTWIAIFQRPERDTDYTLPGYIRLSEWVDVQFPDRAPYEVVPEQIAELDKIEHELRSKFQEKLHAIAEERAKLRAITYVRGAT